eukprot:2247649-Pyramimonas_sp.AAC.1
MEGPPGADGDALVVPATPRPLTPSSATQPEGEPSEQHDRRSQSPLARTADRSAAPSRTPGKVPTSTAARTGSRAPSRPLPGAAASSAAGAAAREESRPRWRMTHRGPELDLHVPPQKRQKGADEEMADALDDKNLLVDLFHDKLDVALGIDEQQTVYFQHLQDESAKPDGRRASSPTSAGRTSCG